MGIGGRPQGAGALPPFMDDAVLLERALRGDRAAFASVYDRHAKAVYGFALRMVGDRGAAEDVTQEAFLALLRGRAFDASRGFLPWLLTVTRNEALDHLRRRGRRPESPIDRELLETAPAREHDATAKDAVETALRLLPGEFREAVGLCDAMGLSYHEAAEVMGCPLGTVGTRVMRGRRCAQT